MASYENQDSFVFRQLGTHLIPPNLPQRPQFMDYTVEPPTPNFRLKELLSSDTNTITGEGSGLGYSTTTRILDHILSASTNNLLPFTVDAITSGNPELQLRQSFATKLLVEILADPYHLERFSPEISNIIAQIIVNNVSGYLNIINIALKQDPQIAIAESSPHLCRLPNPSSREDIKQSDIIRTIQSKRKQSNQSFPFMIKSLEEYKKPLVLIDASDNTSRDQLYPLISESLSTGVEVKIIGPDRTVSNILTGNTAILRWDEASLLSIVTRGLNEASESKYDSLLALSDRSLRTQTNSPETIIIKQMVSHNFLHPRALISTINSLLMSAANSNAHQISNSMLDHQLAFIRN